ncbi:hypothetical protein [Nonomuraea cavernae]|uniref:Uncharacterized protein n=1 Tax=Nonomuraea cavernae TaxID=2045107 RepID=A0A918DHB9_9ACTN|nr:hypothetical protein [Nonomuraea cavernae]MCA2186950.1 hypothetical protein [Nonomuraea cavernae]GGO67093.1 hypothetical protein GCM10012289_22690 [Nonomuraea cavernae]
MTRFQCTDCGNRSRSAYRCRRCGTRRQVEVCASHGARCLAGCRLCRILTRSQSGI